MRKRIYRILLICSPYDAFILEEDGRIDGQLFDEYVSLNLRYPPEIVQVSSAEEAIQALSLEKFYLVINMLSVIDKNPFELNREIKQLYPNIPIVILTPFSRELNLKLATMEEKYVDYVFCWLGDVAILLAIIKLLEDKLNVDYDVKIIGVQTIILVEDSFRYYSSYLPNLYKLLINQAKTYVSEGLNEHEKMIRMRGRPKLLLATNYEEATELYEKYKSNLLGLITDVRYKRSGKDDREAGFKLVRIIREENPYLPIIVQSSEEDNRDKAFKNNALFLNKYSKTLLHDLRKVILEQFAFGDFVFKNPETDEEVARVSNLKDLQDCIMHIPGEAIILHSKMNYFSRWLKARALFSISRLFEGLKTTDFQDAEAIKEYVYETISWYRTNHARGIIAKFYRDDYDKYLLFTRLGDGSLGGKARGLAFIDNLISRNFLNTKYENLKITIPRTLVITTEIFDEFMITNDLYKVGLSNMSDDEILKHFVNAKFPESILKDLRKFISIIKNPLAVRSSSLLEDSHYQPFAGIYTTYMIPKTAKIDTNMRMLTDAIKCVYASVYYHDSKSYMTATKNVIDEEKMAVVIQEVVGKKHEQYFYPEVSGVARSINVYPIEKEKPEEGIINLALGLGKYIVDGGTSLRYSPKHPKKLLQLSSPEIALRETQKSFFALDMDENSFQISTDDGMNLVKLDIDHAKKDDVLTKIASTYDYNDHIIRDGLYPHGQTIISFSNIIKFKGLPLNDALSDILKTGQREMNNPVEIEFAVSLDYPEKGGHTLSLLQIRPIVDNKETIDVDLKSLKKEEIVIFSKKALGNGIIDDVNDIVYIRPENFDPANNTLLAQEIGAINEKLQRSRTNYILIGPGRWGSSDPYLGIPVKWAQISAARVIVETALRNYQIDPSQGTHFFQNLTSFKVGYFTVNPCTQDGSFDLAFLNRQKCMFENERLRHIRFAHPLKILIDGKKGIGAVVKPERLLH
ncbi:MAG TPA: PEP/pyruvate-binding domain-containing protein [Bacteroidales bacterium]|nr:PEP/pyruvate-binding domain-containing protein [Bacteroidales bacterium]